MLVLFSAASAAPCAPSATDLDGDCWHTNTSPSDCRDGDDTIHPAAAEDGTDRTDEDCDGRTTIRREFVSGFEGLSDFATTGAVTTGLLHGRVKLDTATTSPSEIALRGAIPWESGELTVTVSVYSFSASFCTVSVDDGSGYSTIGTIVAAGVLTFSTTDPQPGGSIDDIAVTCYGSGETQLDWITLQNGPYSWAPINDTSFAFDDMGLPNGGRESVLRLTEGYTPGGGGTPGGMVLAGSDVGGFAWTPMHDPAATATAWHTANGTWDDWNDASEYHVMEALGIWRGDQSCPSCAPNYRDPAEHDVYALLGTGTWQYGGLWLTREVTGETVIGGQTWIELQSDLNAFKHRDDCDDGDPKSLSSGRLLLPYPGDPDWIVVASGGVNAAGSVRGVYLWDRAIATPTSTLPSQYAIDLPKDPLGYSALPSALAAGESDDEPFVLIGYRTLADGVYDQTALYLCPAGFDPAVTSPASVTCVAVEDAVSPPVWPTDVRDIEPDPNNPTRFYIADAGRWWNGVFCDYDEPTVYVVDVSGNSSAGWSFHVWNSDDADSEPDWLRDTADTGEEAYYGSTDGRACLAAPATSYGDLVPPTSVWGTEAADISTIAVDPEGTYIVAFFPRSTLSRRFGCAPVFRAELAALTAGSTLEWEPLQNYEHDGMAFSSTADTGDGVAPLPYEGGHAEARNAVIDAAGSFLEDEPLLWAFAGTFVHDAVMVPTQSALGQRSHLLAGGAFDFWALADVDGSGVGTVGWDSPATDDLDLIRWKLAFAGASGEPTFQDLSSTCAAVCPGCAGTNPITDLLLAGGEGDYKYANLTAEVLDVQSPATRPCEMHMLLSSPLDVSVWADPETEDPAQAWMVLSPQGTANTANTPTVDYTRQRALFFSQDDTDIDGDGTDDQIGDAWCWDGFEEVGGAAMTFVSRPYLGSGTPTDELVCQDSGWNTPSPGWPACGAEPRAAMANDGVGLVWAADAIAQDRALLAATPACTGGQDCDTDSGTASEEDPGSGGLWVATFGGFGPGISYVKVPYLTAGVTRTGAASPCLEEEFFEYRFDTATGLKVNRALQMTVHPSARGVAAGDTVRAFLSSRHEDCGIAEVTFELDDEVATASWSLLELDHDGGDAGTDPDCDLYTGDEWSIFGSHASSDGRWLLVYGGQPDVSPTANTALCAVDLTHVSSSGAYDRYSSVMFDPNLQMRVNAVLSHPHLDNTWYVGGYATYDDLTKPAGIFALQRRRKWASTLGFYVWNWSFLRVSEDDLQHRIILDLDLGPGNGGRTSPITTLYATTGGGAFWDGEVTW